MCLRIFLPALLMAGSGSCLIDTQFSRKFKCQMAGSGSIDTRETRSLIGCSKRCLEHSECRSFIYEPSSRECQRHSSLYASSSSIPNPITDTTAVYYERKDNSPSTTSTSTTTTTTSRTTPTTTSMTSSTDNSPSPTSTSTTTATMSTTTSTTTPTTTSMTSCTGVPCVPPPFVCPVAHMTSFIQYCNQTFSFRLYFDVNRNFADAKAECESQCGHLVEILTIEKLNFAKQLVQCPDYSSSSFWIDGEFNGATSRYETSNGEPLPLDQGTFFVPARPGTFAVNRCVRIDPGHNHLLEDDPCSTAFYMICEKP